MIRQIVRLAARKDPFFLRSTLTQAEVIEDIRALLDASDMPWTSSSRKVNQTARMVAEYLVVKQVIRP